MSDSQEKSDDLIAELAKLMASNAQGSESEVKPTVIKLAPLSEATVPPPAPIRIPGMEAPAAPAAAPAPAVRIPGMEKPAGVETPAPAASGAAAPKAQPTTQFDFGRPPSSAPVIAPEPLANWQSREAPKPMPPAPTPAPRPMVPGASMPAPEAAPTPVSARLEPIVSVVPAPPAIPSPSTSSPAPDEGSIKAGFGHASDRGAGDRESGAQAQPEDAVKPATGPEYDPIADLIAAELDAAQAEPIASEAPKVEAAKPAHVFPASVEVVPAHNFGNSTAGQAPVLVAKPVGTAAPRATPIAPLAFRPLPAAPKPAESDKFAVAPVFGLGSSPAPAPSAAAAPPVPSRPAAAAPMARVASPAAATPKPDTDPMDEIENLIGEAVRVQLSGSDHSGPAKQAPGQPPAAPVVPPLTTGFAPRRAGLRDNEPQLQSAEAAILAAAAATGAEVGRIDSETGDERPYKRVKLKPQKANMFSGVRQYVGLAVAGTLLLAAGFGLYWVLGMGRGDGTAPVLTADATPAKQVPPITTAEVTQPARSVVFDEIDGVPAVDSAETLVSRDETAGASVADVARVVAPESADSTESGLANRKVRTVTVRPDGTIVSGDEAVAGTQALPVERPNVPAVPGATTEPSDLLTAAAATNTDTAPAVPAATETAALDPIAAAIAGAEATEAPAPIEVAALVPASPTPAVFDASIVAPVPMPRPADRSSLAAGGAAIDTADVSAAIAPRAPASTPLVALTDAAPTASSSSSAAAYVQLASLPSEAEARSAVSRMQSRYGSLFGGESLLVQRAELGDGRVTYRLRLPASSLQSATQICASIKANGGDCFATNG